VRTAGTEAVIEAETGGQEATLGHAKLSFETQEHMNLVHTGSKYIFKTEIRNGSFQEKFSVPNKCFCLLNALEYFLSPFESFFWVPHHGPPRKEY
jgi:hypothetical protein